MSQFITDRQLLIFAENANNEFPSEMAIMACELLQLRQQAKVTIRLPYCSASPVCEIEAGYAAGVSDSREAIRRAGYPIEGDD